MTLLKELLDILPVTESSPFPKHPMDKKLATMGWEEKYGVALWAHPKYGSIMIDSNADWPAVIYPGPNSSHDSFIAFIDKPEDIDKEIEGWIKKYASVISPEEIKEFGPKWAKFVNKVHGDREVHRGRSHGEY